MKTASLVGLAMVMGGQSTGTWSESSDGYGVFNGEFVNVPSLKAPGFIKAAADGNATGNQGSQYGLGDPHPLSLDEEYLTPYMSELFDYRDNPIARRYIWLANLANVLPTFVVDLILMILVDFKVIPETIPINKGITIPLAGQVFTVVSIELHDLPNLKNLWVPHLLPSGKYTWAGGVDTSKFGLTVNTKFSFLGMETDVAVDLSLKDVHFGMEAIVAFNRTRLCEVYNGITSVIGSHCGGWALGVKDVSSGFNLTKLDISAGDIDFDITGGGVIFGRLKDKILSAMHAEKPQFLKLLPTTIAPVVKTAINLASLAQLAGMESENDCIPPSAAISNETLNVSRICISNNAAFLESFTTANCALPEATGVSSPSDRFPIDQSRCMDIAEELPGTKEGDVLRTVSHAILGFHEILYPPMRYVPNSNVAGFECSGSTLHYHCGFNSIVPVDKSLPAPASKVCVTNHAGIVMSFEALNGGVSIGSTGRYPIEQTKCIDLNGMSHISPGDTITTRIHACAARTKDGDRQVKYTKNNFIAAYECTGTTLFYSCKMTGSYDQATFEKSFGQLDALMVHDVKAQEPGVLCSSADHVDIVV